MASEETGAEGDQPGPRRQERGRKRIELILHAAAAVFAEHGYDASTTNAIAAHAGISPGSLYQFFKNKDDIAHALAEHYGTQLAALRGETFASERFAAIGPDDLDVVVDSLLGPIVDFNLAHPGFKALFARTDMPAGLRDAVRPIQAAIHQSVAALIGRTLPDRPDEEVARVATVAIQIVRGMVPLITEASEPERTVLTGELREALLGYLRGHMSATG